MPSGLGSGSVWSFYYSDRIGNFFGILVLLENNYGTEKFLGSDYQILLELGDSDLRSSWVLSGYLREHLHSCNLRLKRIF